MDQEYSIKKKQLIDYIDDAGWGVGFAIGSAVRQCYKLNRATSLDEKKKYEDGMAWFIKHVSETHGMDIREVMEIVNRITSLIENDRTVSSGGNV